MDDDDSVLFSNLMLQGIPLKDCELAYQDNYDNLRLYVLRDTQRWSFWSMLVEFDNGGLGEDGSVWSSPDLKVEKVFESVAYFDGIRHLDGYYMNYPDVKKLSEVFSILADIESEVCRDYSRK